MFRAGLIDILNFAPPAPQFLQLWFMALDAAADAKRKTYGHVVNFLDISIHSRKTKSIELNLRFDQGNIIEFSYVFTQ